VALAFGLAAATLFPALMMGIFSKRVNSIGAIAGMLVGLVFTCTYIFAYLGFLFIPGTNWVENIPANHVFGIAPTSIGAVGALLNFAVAYAISAVTKEPPVEVQELVESIRVPRGAGASVAH
jgi:cation/acetate symporter